MPESAIAPLGQAARLLVSKIKESALITTGGSGSHKLMMNDEV